MLPMAWQRRERQMLQVACQQPKHHRPLRLRKGGCRGPPLGHVCLQRRAMHLLSILAAVFAL